MSDPVGQQSGAAWWHRTWVRVTGFGLAVVVIFLVALGVGRVVDPAVNSDYGKAARSTDTMSMDDTGSGGSGLPQGLAVSRAGYTLQLVDPVVPGPATIPLSFRIIGPDGSPVTSYAPTHERDLHLVVVRRDFTGFQHVHPTLAADGTWTAPVTVTPGAWRVFTDFKAQGGPALTLGADLSVPGTPAATIVGGPVRSSSDGVYTVTLSGDLTAGQHSMVTATVTRSGQPVTDLQPYLGAYGHLVALREGDLAYLHVHPDGEPGDGMTKPGPDVRFEVEVPTAGRYHLYLDYQDAGVVRTAEFVLDAVSG